MKRNLNEYTKEWDILKKEQKVWVDKYNRTRSSSNKSLYYSKIIEYERKLEALR